MMARSVSSVPRLATSASLCPVAGSLTTKRLLPPTQCPSISELVLSSAASCNDDSGEVFRSIEGSRSGSFGARPGVGTVQRIADGAAVFVEPGRRCLRSCALAVQAHRRGDHGHAGVVDLH